MVPRGWIFDVVVAARHMFDLASEGLNIHYKVQKAHVIL